MKTILGGLLLASGSVLAAQGPILTVQDARGNPMPLQIEELSIEVQFVADVAETTITIGFRNDSERMLEGEFAMPLPAGATVSRYALEVNGQMRESVAVEKERARFAYESIKRQMIDPGFVEREAGNVYRSRIFPILKQSVKRVLLGYVEHLKSTAEGLRYELPLGEPGEVNRVVCKASHLEGENLQVANGAGLNFPAGGWAVLEARGNELRPKGVLTIDAPTPEPNELLVEKGEDGLDYFYLRTVQPPQPGKARRKPATLRLIWDASRSGRERNHDKEMAFLEAYFRSLENGKVVLQLLRHKPIDAGEFSVEDGRWDELRQVLTSLVYDGATRFDRLGLDEVEEDMVFLFTDGVSPFPPGPGTTPKRSAESGVDPEPRPLFVLDAAPSKAQSAIMALAAQSAGAYLDLLEVGGDEAVRKVSEIPDRLLVTGEGIAQHCLEDRRESGGFVRIHGTYRPGIKEGIMVGGIRIEWKGLSKRVDTGVVRRMWAQRALAAMEGAHPHSRKSITEHCRKHNLVSDYTSLIVLERFEDYVRYEIPPPEAELRERWEVEVKREQSRWSRFIRGWEDKREWHAKQFPWLEEALLPRLTQITIWLKSMEKVFQREEIDVRAFDVIKGWRKKVLAVVDRREGLQKQEELEQWKKEVARLVQEGSKLRETPIADPEAGKQMVVSVRGLVVNPGNVTGTKDLTLTRAIEKAGSYSALGSPTAVELYRNGGKTIYNLRSARFEDVPLRPGDMIAVREFNWEMYDWEEEGLLMSSGGGPPEYTSDPRQDPAVFQSDVWVGRDQTPGGGDWGSDVDPFGGGDPGGGADPFGGSDPFGGDEVDRPSSGLKVGLRGEIRFVAGGDDPRIDLKAFAQKVADGGDPKPAYHEMIVGGPLAPATYLELARILFEHGHPEQGEQALSNWMEIDALMVERIRATAMWLGEFGASGAAVELLETLVRIAPEEVLAPYELAHFTLKGDEPSRARAMLRQLIDRTMEADPIVAEIALTDLNGFTASGKLPAPKAEAEDKGAGVISFADNFEADLRIVVATSHPEYRLDLTIFEPSGSACYFRSRSGGRLVRTHGLSEFMVRRALPGTYTVRCSSREPMTARVVLFRDWGRKDQTSKEATALLPGGGQFATLATYEFEFLE